MGIHRPYLTASQYSDFKAADAREIYRRIEDITRKYLKTTGIHNSLIDAMFSTSSKDIKILSDEEYVSKIGFKQPFFDEWLRSKCGELSNSERKDLAKADAYSVYYRDNRIPEGMSEGYIEYLNKKSNDAEKCASKASINHQKEAISKY